VSYSQNAGQNCVGIERLIVHRSQYDEIYNTLVERTKELRLGTAMCQPTDGFMTTADVGAMINSSRFDYLENVLESAQNHGATIDVGGNRWPHPYLEHGSYFSPTIVGDVDPKSHLAQAESECRMVMLSLTSVTNGCSVRSYRGYYQIRYP
jgi:acyl-CoA reductase-like NAD-dependent aldehyde dehydrogenase